LSRSQQKRRACSREPAAPEMLEYIRDRENGFMSMHVAGRGVPLLFSVKKKKNDHVAVDAVLERRPEKDAHTSPIHK